MVRLNFDEWVIVSNIKTEKEEARNGWRFPVRPLVWTVCIAGLLAFLDSQFEWLNERINLDLGVVRIGTFLLSGLNLILWWFWLTFFSGGPRRTRYVLGLIVLIAVSTFFVLMKRISDGDAGFVRFEPRFWAAEKNVSELKGDAARVVDLVTTTKFDFPQFLGPQRNAMISGRRLNPDWSQHAPREIWKHPVGFGWSGFVVVNQAALTQEQRGQDECVTCYDLKTGELLWINRIPCRHEDTMAMGRVGPRATPTVNDGLVYAQGATGWLQCLDGKDGSVVWRVFLPELLGVEMIQARNSEGYVYEFENSRLAWGRSSAPLIVGDKVVVSAGGPTGGPFQTLLAFDKKTGESIWSGGDQMISYGSPSLVELAGASQIVVIAEAQAMGFDPEDGRTLWQHERPGASNGDVNCSQVTVVSGSELLLTKGYGKGGELVRVIPDGKDFSVESVWSNRRVLKTKFTNPVLLDGFAYALSDGFAECTDLATGKRRWKKRGRFGHGQLLLVGNKLLIQSEQGVLYLVAASPEQYQQLGEMKTIEGLCWNTLCLAGDYLLVRSESEMACYRLTFESADSEPGETQTPSAVENETKGF